MQGDKLQRLFIAWERCINLTAGSPSLPPQAAPAGDDT